MKVSIQPSSVRGTILAPRSKSSMQRACAAALLYAGETHVIHPGKSNDDLAALDTIRRLGAELEEKTDRLIIRSKGVHPLSDELNCGESGLGIRMFTPVAALSERPLLISGTGSLQSRPMDFFDAIFPQLGIRIKSNQGRLPLQIQGPLRPANIEVDGSLSSQFLTGLLMAYAAAGAADVTIRVNNLTSKPYIDLTLQVLRHFGWQVENRNYEAFYFPSSNINKADKKDVVRYEVEGDWSGGAFLLVAGAIAGPITVEGLDPLSTQADKAIVQALRSSGAQIENEGSSWQIGPAALRAFEFDATECPDLFPPLVALAACCEGTSTFRGALRLTHKESNRALTLQEEFAKMGIEIMLDGDAMWVKGGKLRAATVHSHHDHRIAMACAVAALRAEGTTTVEEAEAINKSYPDFYAHLQQLGVKVQEEAVIAR